MAIESYPPLKEIRLDEVFLTEAGMDPATQALILDETGNPVKDEVGRNIHDD